MAFVLEEVIESIRDEKECNGSESDVSEGLVVHCN
jgi:hypothetical protein